MSARVAALKRTSATIAQLPASGRGVIAPPKEASAIKSARRAFELLEFFAERRGAATVADVVEALGYPQSSTSMLLRGLAEMRYLEYDRKARTYLPTMRVALLGSWIEDEMFSDANLANLVRRIHDMTGATVFIGMQYDMYVQYVHLMQEPSRSRDWYIKRGSLRPLCGTAIGRVLLSLKSDVEIVYLLRKINAAEPEADRRIAESDLLREIQRVREQGFAYTESAVRPDTAMLAIEMPTPPSQARVAVGLAESIAIVRARREEYLEMLKSVLEPYIRG